MFNKTKIYNVYIKKSQQNAIESALFVRDGFNIWAFIFEIFWFAYHRVWLVIFGLILFYAIKIYLLHSGFINLLQADVLTLALKFFLGFEASNFREKHLEKKGYILIDVVTAHDEMEAQKRFYDKYAFAQSNLQNTNLKAA